MQRNQLFNSMFSNSIRDHKYLFVSKVVNMLKVYILDAINTSLWYVSVSVQTYAMCGRTMLYIPKKIKK